jgi:predicted HAD superfamily Cof-like phosphohydrolase
LKYYNDVKEFHDKFGMVTPPSFTKVPEDLFKFRVLFFEEELNEYVESFETRDLPTAIDSLIDLVYITCGTALLYGVQLEDKPDPIFYEPATNDPPKFLEVDNHVDLVYNLKSDIKRFVVMHQIDDLVLNETGIKRSLSTMFEHCTYGAALMGFSKPRWDLLWNDVHRANMTKERALRAEQSKRGSTYDIIKPAGWVPPQSEELVQKMLRGEL